MKMKQATGHYYPNDNKQAFDLIALSFFIAISLVYTLVVGFKLIKKIQSSLFTSIGGNNKQSDEYRLTSLNDENEDDVEDVKESFLKQKRELQLQLMKLRRTFHFIAVLSFFVLGTGLYMGSRSINYGMTIANRD